MQRGLMAASELLRPAPEAHRLLQCSYRLHQGEGLHSRYLSLCHPMSRPLSVRDQSPEPCIQIDEMMFCGYR